MILQKLDWAVHNPHSATETCSTKILFDYATLSAFHNFCLMHLSVDMKWQKFCFFSIIYPWFLFFGSHLRLPGLQMWSGENSIDQYLILSCMVSKPVTTSIRVAVGNHGYMCVCYTDYQIMHNLQFGLVIHNISFLLILQIASETNMSVYVNPEILQWSFSSHCSACTKFLCKYLVSVVNTWWGWEGIGLSSAFQGHSCLLLIFLMSFIVNGSVFCPQKQKNIAGALAFWMANASELLNFIKQDRDLSRITLDAQDVLAHLVQMAFK